MKSKILTNSALLLLLVFFCSSLASAQDLSSYLTTRVNASAKARIDQTDPTKQSAPPAATGNSTSLVERSSAPDLLGLGLDFLNLTDKLTGNKKSATPKTITFSAYALKTVFSSQDALDPEIYNRDAKWRRVSFTLGYDVPENTDDRDPVLGIKWLAINGRDLSSKGNKDSIKEVQDALNGAGGPFSRIAAEVTNYLFSELKSNGKLPGATTIIAFEDLVASSTEFPKILASLTEDQKKAIDGLISKRISAFVNLVSVTRNAVKTIRERPQLALTFTTTQRKGGRPDLYVGTLTFDKGMGANSITMNGSFIITKNRTGKDSNGGQFAAAFHIPLNSFKPLGYKDPLLLSIEANGKGMTGETPMYKAQAKLTIPLLPGMELPISVSVANRSEFIKEKDVRGKFGFTFDLNKSLKAFRDSFAKRE